jgi:ABC-type uncharacterized transport system substrate-binding protein
MRRAFISRVPGAAQHEASRAFTPVFAGYGEVMRCRPGTATSSEYGTVPDQRCTTRAAHSRCTASGTHEIKRRAFITLLAVLAVCPLGAAAQDISKPARLGYIWIGPKDSEHSTRDGFRQGMRDLGYVEGRDYVLEERYADSQPERLPGIIAELLQLKVALFLSPGVQVTKALMAATSTVPIIATTPDLLASGFVTSLARPGGNVTGMSLTAGPTLSEKWLEILKETFPSVRTVAMLTASGAIYNDRIRAAAEMLALNVRYFPAQDPQEIDRALADIAAMAPDGLIVESDANLVSNRAKILDFVARHRLPTVYGNLDYIPEGGVMAYFTSIFETWRRLATYVDRVLKGAKPGDLPVEQAVKFELVINLKAAKAIGLPISESMLLRADRVVE